MGYDMFLPSSSGCEACESAIKVARRWGYVTKGIEKDKANILLANGNFHGRSITAISTSSDPNRTKDFGPATPGFALVEFGDLEKIENYLRSDPNCCAVMIESIQGEGGVVVPHDGYVAGVKKLCK